jgi:NAD-dependent SIR2 family protein deacetylase
LGGRRVLALTGAGMSTESGIPDYRGLGARPRSPIQHADFLRDARVRARYWARALVGWPKLRAAAPNAAHHALARAEQQGQVLGVVTQNVDGLHGVAGSRRVVELHGALAEVRCLGCAAIVPRDALQARLVEDNPHVASALSAFAPDGDADVDVGAELLAGFRAPDCDACGGVLKPNVVFFGGSVPREVVASAFVMLDEAEVLLVAGTSLAVFSGYRFALRAAERNVPIVVVNTGETRADALAAVKVEGRLGEALPALLDYPG